MSEEVFSRPSCSRLLDGFFFSFFDRAIEIAITSPLTFFFEQLAARSLFLL